MEEKSNASDENGYISINEAAKRLNVSRTRIYEYIEMKRLDARRVAHITVVSEASVEYFHTRSVSGRPRNNIRMWRESPDPAKFIKTVIHVQLRKSQQGTLTEQLHAMKQKKEHMFPGTIDRYISEDDSSPGTIEIELIWKQNELPDEATYQQMLDAFKADFADILHWESARYSTKTVLMHT